jgi:hypothetical protein
MKLNAAVAPNQLNSLLDPEGVVYSDFFQDYRVFPTISLSEGGSPPVVLAPSGIAVFLTDEWTEVDRQDFARQRGLEVVELEVTESVAQVFVLEAARLIPAQPGE